MEEINLSQMAEFMFGQAQLVAKEMLTVGRVQYTAGAAVAFMALLVSLFFLYKLVRRMRKGLSIFSDEEAYCILGFIACTVSSILCSVGLVNSTIMTLTAWFAPRVYILDQLKGLL